MFGTATVNLNQRWSICDLNSMHKIPTLGVFSVGLGDFFFQEHTSLNKLLEGSLFEGRRYVPLDLPAAAALSESQSSFLTALPFEILILIMLSVDDEVDRYCLALSCTRLFSICERYWLQHYTDSFLRSRLLCAGSRGSWNALPLACMAAFRSLVHRPSVLNDKAFPDFPLNDFKKSGIPYSIISDLSVIPGFDNEPDPDPLSTALRQLGTKVWARVIKDSPSTAQDSLFTSISSSSKNVGTFSAYPEALIIRRSLIFPCTTEPVAPSSSGRSKVLCNFSKKSFIVEQPILSVLERAIHKRRRLTLGHFVLSQICCSDESDPTMKNCSTKGRWAGDELAVVSGDVFLEQLQSLRPKDLENWRNVTERALEVLLNMAGGHMYQDLKEQIKPLKTAEEILKDGFA